MPLPSMVKNPAVSVADDSLDQMVEAASVPNLASLFRKAKKAGHIGPVTTYGGPGGV